MPRIDGDFYTEPRMQRNACRHFIYNKLHRQPLHHLDPVAGRILRREQRKAVPGARAETLHMSLEFKVGKSIDFELGMLAEAHIAQLLFLEVAFYPKALSDQSDHRHGLAAEIADMQLINLGDNDCLVGLTNGINKIEQ